MSYSSLLPKYNKNMDYAQLLGLDPITYEYKRFRLKKTLAKPSIDRTLLEIEEAVEVLQVFST